MDSNTDIDKEERQLEEVKLTKPDTGYSKSSKMKIDPKRDKNSLCQNSSSFHLSEASDPNLKSSSSSCGKSEIKLENLDMILDKEALVTNSKNANALSAMEEKITMSHPARSENPQDPMTSDLRNSSNTNFLVYVDNSSGTPVLSQVVREPLLSSSTEIRQLQSRNVISSQIPPYRSNAVDMEKMETSLNVEEKPVTFVFDASIPQHEQQHIYLDSSSIVDLDHSVVLAPDKGGGQNLRQVLVTTHALQGSTSDDRNFHSILVTSEQDLNSSQAANEVNFLPVANVQWENDTKVLGQVDKAQHKELEELREHQRQSDLRSLEQSHLAHQSLIQQRNEKDTLIRKSSLVEHLKGLGIDDTTPIFSSITAKVNPSIMAHVPGCLQFLLKNGCAKISTASFETESECSFQGNLSELVTLHNGVKSLMHLKSHTNVSFQNFGDETDKKEDKSIYCNLLVPYISSKGRMSKQSVKAKQADVLLRLDDELTNEEGGNTGEERVRPKRTWRNRRLHLRKGQRVGPKSAVNSSQTSKSQESQFSIVENSAVDEERNLTLSRVTTDRLTAEETEASADPSSNDALQVRLRQEQIKYQQIINDNINRMRQFKSMLMESAKRAEADQALNDDSQAKKSDQSTEEVPRRRKGRPPKKYDPNDNQYRVKPRNPMTESDATKQCRLYEENVMFKFFCDHCSFKTKRKSHFETHLQCHKNSPDTRHSCGLCEFTSISLPALGRHELKHKKNLLRCEVCSVYKTDKKYLMQRHIRMKHSNFDDRPKFKCDQCSKEFHSSLGLRRHQAKHIKSLIDKAKDVTTKNSCPHCQKDFGQRIHLRRHIRDTHGPQTRPHLCDDCGKSFKRTDALKQHKLVHVAQGARKLPFKCDECNKGFRSQSHLREHMSMHSTERPFLCHYCGAAFKTQPVQKKHILTLHIRPRTHVCSVCCRQFNTKNALLKHENTHKPPDDKLWPPMETEAVDKTVAYGTHKIKVIGVNVSKSAEASIGRHQVTPALVVNVAGGAGVVIDDDNEDKMTTSIIERSNIEYTDTSMTLARPSAQESKSPQQRAYIHEEQRGQSFYYLTR